MTPLEDYLRLLKPITNALASIGQDITNAIEADKFLSDSEKTFMLENSRGTYVTLQITERLR